MPGGGVSLQGHAEEAEEAAGAAGLGHLPQVAWQKLPSSMKTALHFPNPFCRQHAQLEHTQELLQAHTMEGNRH